jgi:mannose-6-phosphate isomerase class I
MKCIILANNINNIDGKKFETDNYDSYDRVLEENEGNSLFKKTIVCNMPYCDKYLIISKKEYMNEISRQIEELRDVEYSIIESGDCYTDDIEKAVKNMPEEELFLIIPCEIKLENKSYNCNSIKNYKANIIKAKKCAISNEISMLCVNDSTTGIVCFKNKNFIKISENRDIFKEEVTMLNSNSDCYKSDNNENVDFCVKLNPAFKDYLWGGIKLRDKYGKKCDMDIIAESWELSAHEDGESIISSGICEGKYFREYLDIIGNDNLGWKCSDMDKFPILIKFIDAKNPLSIQVHPDDDYALMYEDEYGKNEMWYILDCEEGAGIYCGFKQDTSADEVRERIENNTILDILNWIPVKKGEVYYIKAGTVHAIGGGIMICEIQQSSNCTYRLYDYDRIDKNGNKRELHIDKALDVLNYKKYEPQDLKDLCLSRENYSMKVLASCKYFKCVSYNICGKMDLQLNNSSFKSIICVNGNGTIKDGSNAIEFKMGDSLFLPKSNHSKEIEGNCEIVITEL